MSQSGFSKAVETFSSAKRRYWTPSTKSFVYAAQAGVTLGLAVGAAAVGQTWLSGALAGAVVRASTKAYQSYKEGKKSLFEGAPVRGGSPRTGDEFWRDQGEQAAGSMNDDDLVAFHSGGAKALVYADDDSEYSLVDISGISDAGGRGFDNVIAIGLKDGPSAAVAYMNGVRSNLESRNFSPTVVAPPRPLVGGVIGGGAGSTSSGGVAGLSQ